MTKQSQQTDKHNTPSRQLYLQNGEASLAVSLSPLLALGIPELGRNETCPRHAKVRGVKDITGLTVHIDVAVAKAEDLQGLELAASRC